MLAVITLICFGTYIPAETAEKQDVYGRTLTDDFYIYRNELNNNERALYDQIYANAMDARPYFKTSTKAPASRVQAVFLSVQLDNPDIFWLNPEKYEYTYDNSNNITSMTLHFYDCVNNLDEY
jgi:hypothetical protein